MVVDGRTFRFQLYVAGKAEQGVRWKKALEKAMEAAGSVAEVEVIDVLENVDQAIANRIFATPLLLQVQPDPPRRFIGDFSDPRPLLRQLGMEVPPDD